MGRKTALILINNTAGLRQGQDDTFDLVKEAAGAGFEPVVYPIIPGTGLTSENIIGEYEGRIGALICVGGDGTLNHVTNSIMALKQENRPVIGYIPSGSTNDFARCLGIPENREGAVRTAVRGRTYGYDIGRMNDSYFNYVAAFGAFSEISYDTDQALKNVFGYAAYVINAILKLPQNVAGGCKMKIEADGKTFEGEYIFGAVCNSVSVGGMKLFENESIKLNDGKMELLLINHPKNILELNSILSALALGSVNNPHIVIKQIKSVSFKAPSPVSWTLDGEFGGSSDSTEISVIKRGMRIRAGSRAREG